MTYDLNRYHDIGKAGPEAVRLTATLMQSYPVTRACLGILGKELLNRVQFGFFMEGTDIIIQDEKGKDLFMLCDKSVDVLVDGKKIVAMDAPALFGDKGIVEPQSRRAATIRVAENKTCFFIKIPMEFFIRNFNDMALPDESFTQEIGIFYNMFKGIQSRLFEYAFIQKNLWEEVKTSLTLSYTHSIIKSLDNRIDKGWNPVIWDLIKEHLKNELKFNWPEEIPLNISTFRIQLRQFLDTIFPRNIFKGKDSDYIKSKHQLWRKWLTTVAKLISKELPDEDTGSDFMDIQLFNPRNYQIRIQGLIKAIEKKFLSSKKRTHASGKSRGTTAQPTDIRKFFGRSSNNNTFDLKSYLSTFEQNFELKYPKRMQMQIAQRTALAAAKCENEFNVSVAAMKSFQEKTRKEAARSYKVKERDLRDGRESDEILIPLHKAITVYNKQPDTNSSSETRKPAYIKEKTPNILQLLKSCSSRESQENVKRAFYLVLNKLDVLSRLFTLEFIRDRFFFCDVSSGTEISNEELVGNFWMPLSSGIQLQAGEVEMCSVPPGRLIGGKGWMQSARNDKGREIGKWLLKFPEKESENNIDSKYLLLVFPQHTIPWEVDPTPESDQFKTIYMPAMQWLINKQIEHILGSLTERDEIFQNWIKTEQIIKLENKVAAFENSRIQMTPFERKKIIEFVDNTMSLQLSEDEPLKTDQLAKKIYNHILKQMMEDYSDVPVETLGNKTYTKWRLILSEIVQIMEQSEVDETIASASPYLDMIQSELVSILNDFSIPGSSKFIGLTGKAPHIHLSHILNALDDSVDDALLLFNLILSTLETFLRLLFEETCCYKTKYQEAHLKRPQTGVQDLQVKSIMETALKLKHLISEQEDQTKSVPTTT